MAAPPRPEPSRPRGRCPCQELQSASPRWRRGHRRRRPCRVLVRRATPAPTRQRSPARQAPQTGGTLRIISAGGPDHIDTVSAYYTVDYQLERAYTRQLLQYPTSRTPHLERGLDGGHHADRRRRDRGPDGRQRRDHRRRHRLHLPHQAGRRLEHHASPPGDVGDFLREFKAFFNPVSPVGNPVYYTSTIKGLQAYDNEETAYFATQGAPGDRREHRELPEHAQHRRHQDAELVDDPVHADGPGQRLPVHAGDAVRLGPSGGVRQLRAEQPPA